MCRRAFFPGALMSISEPDFGTSNTTLGTMPPEPVTHLQGNRLQPLREIVPAASLFAAVQGRGHHGPAASSFPACLVHNAIECSLHFGRRRRQTGEQFEGIGRLINREVASR